MERFAKHLVLLCAVLLAIPPALADPMDDAALRATQEMDQADRQVGALKQAIDQEYASLYRDGGSGQPEQIDTSNPTPAVQVHRINLNFIRMQLRTYELMLEGLENNVKFMRSLQSLHQQHKSKGLSLGKLIGLSADAERSKERSLEGDYTSFLAKQISDLTQWEATLRAPPKPESQIAGSQPPLEGAALEEQIGYIEVEKHHYQEIKDRIVPPLEDLCKLFDALAADLTSSIPPEDNG